ncbi:MAG: hypothetical protein NVSMB17_04580 [Candidatus Dormibacteria bacterium]
MILQSLEVNPADLQHRTGWEIKPEGACKGHLCVPLPAAADGVLKADVLAEKLRMALVEDREHGLWALGPESGGRALTTAVFPDLQLPDWRGDEFDFRSLRGQKIFLLAWASW